MCLCVCGGGGEYGGGVTVCEHVIVCVSVSLCVCLCHCVCVVAVYSECVCCVVSLFSLHAAVYICHVSFSDFSHGHTILFFVVVVQCVYCAVLSLC